MITKHRSSGFKARKSRNAVNGGVKNSKVKIVSRKTKRKEERALKKQNKFQKYLQKNSKKPSQKENVVPSSTVEDDESDLLAIENEETPLESLSKPPLSKAQVKEKKKLKKQRKDQRKKLQIENEMEEKTINQMEKKLGLNKRKTSHLPKSFSEDGLDFILDLCDSSKMQDILREEGIQNDEDEDFEVYLNKKRSLKKNPKPLVDDDDDENDNEMEVDDKNDRPTSEEDESMFLEEEEDILGDTLEGEELLEEEQELHEEDARNFIDNEAEEISEEEDSDEEKDDDNFINDNESFYEESSDDETEELSQCQVLESSEEEADTRIKEDIYGRKKDSSGNIVKYVPPALRETSNSSKEAQLRLQRRMKGLLNRLAESNFAKVSSEIEALYMNNSRNDTNLVLCNLLKNAIVQKVSTPERLVLEHGLLVSVLQANVGVEVGASVLQYFVKFYDEKYAEGSDSKEVDNVLLFVCHLYTFKINDSKIVFDILNKFTESFNPKDVELILVILKSVGFSLRKDDPTSLKASITYIQKKASEVDTPDSRTQFMLDVLMAIKNNNVKKIPNYNQEYLVHLKKIFKSFLRPGCGSSPLSVGLGDLLGAKENGRWWIVGSAWSGREKSIKEEEPVVTKSTWSSDLVELARKMRMNTDARRSIFCTLMSSEDYMDAFEKLMKLTGVPNKETEVCFVILDCCLQEKQFNPYYPQVGLKLASLDRKYRMATQFGLWDKFKTLGSLSTSAIRRLGNFVAYLISNFCFTLSLLKVVTFTDIDKASVKFMKFVLSTLLQSDKETFKRVFESVAGYSKLKDFRDSLVLFMKHFMVKEGIENPLSKRISTAESMLSLNEKRFFF